MSGDTEQRFDLRCRAVNVNAVHQPAGARNGDGREYAQNAECEDKLDDRKGSPHWRLGRKL
jgi:hypothetical protein